MTARRLLGAAVLALAVAACGGDNGGNDAAGDTGYETVTTAAIRPGDDVPAPTGDVVLTITGDITTTNVDDTLQFDLATLEQLGLVTYSVDDLQAEARRVTFTGVLVRTLLDVAGAAADATELHASALNDYTITIPRSDIDDYPVLLATMADGARMPVERYGPTRIVYPYDDFDLDSTVYDPRWIWQLATIDVQ